MKKKILKSFLVLILLSLCIVALAATIPSTESVKIKSLPTKISYGDATSGYKARTNYFYTDPDDDNNLYLPREDSTYNAYCLEPKMLTPDGTVTYTSKYLDPSNASNLPRTAPSGLTNKRLIKIL